MVAAHPIGRPPLHRASSGRLQYVLWATNVSYEEYHPYGTTAWWTDPGSTVSQKRYRYNGKERDEESGLYHYGARQYASWLGRWTSVDVKDPGGNYVYVVNSPVLMGDPDGRIPKRLVGVPVLDPQSWTMDEHADAAVAAHLEERGIKYVYQPTIEYVDPTTGETKTGNPDFAYRDPNTGRLKFLEAKNTNPDAPGRGSSWTPGQRVYRKMIDEGKEVTIVGNHPEISVYHGEKVAGETDLVFKGEQWDGWKKRVAKTRPPGTLVESRRAGAPGAADAPVSAADDVPTTFARKAGRTVVRGVVFFGAAAGARDAKAAYDEGNTGEAAVTATGIFVEPVDWMSTFYYGTAAAGAMVISTLDSAMVYAHACGMDPNCGPNDFRLDQWRPGKPVLPNVDPIYLERAADELNQRRAAEGLRPLMVDF